MKSSSKISVILVLSGITQCQPPSHPSQWNDEKLNHWFESGEFLNGLQATPDPSINRRTFAVHYYNHKEMWDKAFTYLKSIDLADAALGRVELGNEMYAFVNEYPPKNRDEALFEVHNKFIDIQWVLSGTELMDVASLKDMTITKLYNPESDLAFGTVPAYTELRATSERFYIFFPDDAHRPALKAENWDNPVRKVVVKVPYLGGF